MPAFIIIISFLFASAFIGVQIKSVPEEIVTTTPETVVEIETTVIPTNKSIKPTVEKTKIVVPHSTSTPQTPITIPPIYIVMPPPPAHEPIPETPAPEVIETPPVASAPTPPPTPPILAIQMKVNGEETNEITVNKGSEVTLYWLMTGESARCKAIFPSGEETIYEEQTRKETIESDFTFEVRCTGNSSGRDIKNSILIKTQ